MILSFLASDSVGMIYMRSNLDDNLTWVLGVHICVEELIDVKIYCSKTIWHKKETYYISCACKSAVAMQQKVDKTFVKEHIHKQNHN